MLLALALALLGRSAPPRYGAVLAPPVAGSGKPLAASSSFAGLTPRARLDGCSCSAEAEAAENGR